MYFPSFSKMYTETPESPSCGIRLTLTWVFSRVGLLRSRAHILLLEIGVLIAVVGCHTLLRAQQQKEHNKRGTRYKFCQCISWTPVDSTGMLILGYLGFHSGTIRGVFSRGNRILCPCSSLQLLSLPVCPWPISSLHPISLSQSVPSVAWSVDCIWIILAETTNYSAWVCLTIWAEFPKWGKF